MYKRIIVEVSVLLLTLSSCAGTQLYQTSDWVKENTFTTGVEGPALDAKGNLYAVNFQRQGTIGVVSGKENAELYIELPEGSIGNGIRFNKNEDMYIADYSGHNILKVNGETKQISAFAHSDKMNQPNDIAIAPNGILYASDPNWVNSTGNLWKIDLQGNIVLLEGNMGTTNGIEVSPDGKTLYINESVQRNVFAYDLNEAGEISHKRLFIAFNDFGVDGMRCDAKGNVYIARYGAGIVAIVSPLGELIREVPLTGQHPTNVAFGGRDGRQVFVTMQKRGNIETFITDTPGRAWAERHTK